MSMRKNQGHKTITKESKQSEYNHIKWSKEIFNEIERETIDTSSFPFKSKWEMKYSIPINELIDFPVDYAVTKNGGSSSWESDGGFIFYDKKLIGVAENKFQHERPNAVERAFRYLALLEGPRIFISCSGTGFVKAKKGEAGGSTGAFIDVAKYAKIYVIENINDEEEFKKHFKKWIKSLV